jgi:thioesterase domain-containing protein
MAQIEARFSQELPLSTLFQAGTIEHLATLLRSSSESQWSPLVGIQTAGAKLPFFCAHPLGGNVLGYVDLARYLTLEQPFYGLQAPGVDGQREPYNRIEDLAAHYIEALSLVQRSGPYLLGGHSLGGIVAFEMAQQLQAQGQKVALLAIMDTPAPINGETPEPIDEAKWLYKRARVLERFFGENLSISYDKLQQLESEEQLSYFLDKLRCAHLIPPDAGQQMIRRILQVQKASHQALQSYIPQVYRGRITLFRASEVLAEDSGGVFAQSFRDRALAWGELTTEPVKIQSVPGNHITMLAEPHVRVLGNKLKNCLDVATHNTKRSGP